LLLHGGGGDIDELRLCGDLPRTERVVVAFVQSSQHVATGKYGWLDLDRSTRDLTEAERLIRAAGAWATDRMVIGGYSQGGRLAILVALTQRPFPTRGFVGFGVPTDTLQSPLETEIIPCNPPVRGWIGLGVDDRPWRVALANQLVARLADHGVRSHVQRIPGLAHAPPPDCGSRLRDGIRFVVGDVR
jgi:pimeloyl-ACP methyl ester carboxylesterase